MLSERIVAEVDESLKAEPIVEITAVTPTQFAIRPANNSADGIARTVAARIAALFQTVEARVAALCEPPWISEYNSRIERLRLLWLWRKAAQGASAQAELDTLREAALPRLYEMLNQSCLALRSKQRGRRTHTTTMILPDFTSLSKAEDEIKDIWETMVLLGGIQAWSQLKQVLPKYGLEKLQHRLMYRWLRDLSQQGKPDSALLPLVREFETMRATGEHAGRGRSRQRAYEEEMERVLGLSSSALAVLVMYKMDSPEALAEARCHLEAGVVSPQIAGSARQKRDYAMLVPLIRMPLGYAASDVLALWDDLRQNQPEQVPVIAHEVFVLLAGAPDYSLAHIPLAILERFDKGDSFFCTHADLLAQCLESPLPEVVHFATVRLLMQPNAPVDWSLACQHAAEKLWSERAGLAKDAAKFLGQIGAQHQEAAMVAWTALSDALSLHALPLLEAILRAMVFIKKSRSLLPDLTMRRRLEELSEEQPGRFGRLCEKLLKGTSC